MTRLAAPPSAKKRPKRPAPPDDKRTVEELPPFRFPWSLVILATWSLLVSRPQSCWAWLCGLPHLLIPASFSAIASWPSPSVAPTIPDPDHSPHPAPDDEPDEPDEDDIFGGVFGRARKGTEYVAADDGRDPIPLRRAGVVVESDNGSGAEAPAESAPTQESCAADTTVWEDSELTTALWQLVYDNNLEGLFEVLEEHPSLAHKRSSDGRGLLWWAYEYERHEMVQLLLARGVDQYAQDKFGKRPIQLKNKLAAECRLGEHNIKCPG